MSQFEESLDAWITSPGTRQEELRLYCVNPACLMLNEPVLALAHTEYGATTFEPDGCPDCGQPLEEEPLEVVNDEG